MSKIYERLKLSNILDKTKCIRNLINFFSKFQCGFQKGFNTKHCFITMIEKSQRPVDGGSQARALLTDLSKAFDCIDHELLIAKLYAYGFDKISKFPKTVLNF